MKPAVVILASIALLALAGCGDKETQTRGGDWGAPPKIVTAEARLENLTDEIQALGTVKANESVDIRPRIASLVERIAFDDGDLVGFGDLVVDLERREIFAGVALAVANLKLSRSIFDRS